MSIGGPQFQQFQQPQQQVPGQQPGVPVQKPKSNIYTMLLFLALVALGLAIAMLCLEMQKYNWDFKANEVQLRGSLERPTAIAVAWHAVDSPCPVNSPHLG